MSELSTGEFKVRINFNASGDGYVDQIKRKAAELIDLIEQIPLRGDADDRQSREYGRLKALAMTSVEEGTMWAVKAATV